MTRDKISYSGPIEGDAGNYNAVVKFDFNNNYFGITQAFPDGTERVLLSTKQIYQLISFVTANPALDDAPQRRKPWYFRLIAELRKRAMTGNEIRDLIGSKGSAADAVWRARQSGMELKQSGKIPGKVGCPRKVYTLA